MGKGMMMIKSSFNGLAATGAGMACSVSQEKVVTWIAVSPAVTVVLDATDGPTQADEGTVSLAAYTCRGKRTANTVITSTLTDERGRAYCGESCQSEETVEASHCAVRTWATKEYSLQTLTFLPPSYRLLPSPNGRRLLLPLPPTVVDSPGLVGHSLIILPRLSYKSH